MSDPNQPADQPDLEAEYEDLLRRALDARTPPARERHDTGDGAFLRHTFDALMAEQRKR